MPTPTTTRSGRRVKNKSQDEDKLAALEILKRQQRGEFVEIEVAEDAPLFEEVDEEEYIRCRKRGFVEGSDEEEEEDDYDDFIDDQEEEKPKKQAKGRGKKGGTAFDIDPKQSNLKQFLTSKPREVGLNLPKFEKPQARQSEDQDAILSQMLFDVPASRTNSVSKPLKGISTKVKDASEEQVVASKISRVNYGISSLKSSYLEAGVSTLPERSPPEFESETNENKRRKLFEDLENTPMDSCMDSCIDLGDDFDDSMPAIISEKTDNTVIEKFYHCVNPVQNLDIVAVPLDSELKENLEFLTDEDNRQFCRFYWYDCQEDNLNNRRKVYLFGKIYAKVPKLFVSCCIVVNNLRRVIYLLIADGNKGEDVIQEFTHIHAKKYNITNFNCKIVTKRNPFAVDSGVPETSEYVMVEYPANQTVLPNNIAGQTFTKILNLNEPCMEKFIVDLKIKGPSWLRVYEPVAPNSPITWTRVELVAETPEKISIEDNYQTLPKPYLSVLSLSIRPYTNANTKRTEILAISVMANSCMYLDKCLTKKEKATHHFCIFAKPTKDRKLKLPYDFTWLSKKYKRTRLEVVDTERDLLVAFMERFNSLDPDIVVGHDLVNFCVETLLSRMRDLKVGECSKLGRFRRKDIPTTKASLRIMLSGRVMCDTRVSAMELIKARSYDLSELCRQVLKEERHEFNHDQIEESYTSSEKLLQMIDATWQDVDNIMGILIELNIIPLAYKITCICGNTLARTLNSGRNERNEFLLLHAFKERGFICPEKIYSRYQQKQQPASCGTGEGIDEQQTAIRKKAAYSGGLVLEPKVGYYNNFILLMDFNSLYPSIIQEFNICFSTVVKPTLGSSQKASVNVDLIAEVPEESKEVGVLPNELRKLVERRQKVKQLIKDSKQQDQLLMLDIEQKALKLTANSMYGCLGFEYSRFYAKHLASLVTFKGREILTNTRILVEKLGYEVIYGDTDSLMIDTKLTNYDEVLQKGTAIKTEVNRTFKLLEIDIDGVYRPLLLLKKKNYAGMMLKKLADGNLESCLEAKGLDTVRRDRAIIAKEAGDFVLKTILTTEKDIIELIDDVHQYLRLLADDIRNNRIEMKKFLISKQLNRNPEEYKDTKGMGHVVLAKRYNSDPNNVQKLRSGDTIEYLICIDGSSESANQRAYTLRELEASNGSLKLDIEYYLCQQIHPMLVRFLGVISETNPFILAEMLGVEKSNQVHIPRLEGRNAEIEKLASKGVSRFNSCKALMVKCPNCSTKKEIRDRIIKNKTTKLMEMSLTTCNECNFLFVLKSKSIVAEIISQIQHVTQEFYTTSFVCDNSECLFETRNVFGRYVTNESSGCKLGEQLQCDNCDSGILSAKISDKEHNLQLRFFSHLLDLERELLSSSKLKPLSSATTASPSGELDVNGVNEDLISMYKECKAQVDYALRHSAINVVDLNLMFAVWNQLQLSSSS